MLDVIDVARRHGIEEGRKEGRRIGIEEAKRLGILETTRKMLLILLFEKFNGFPSDLTERIRKISDLNLLDSLFNKAMRCESMQAFTQILSRSE